jgi:hypothetical protein
VDVQMDEIGRSGHGSPNLQGGLDGTFRA